MRIRVLDSLGIEIVFVDMYFVKIGPAYMFMSV